MDVRDLSFRAKRIDNQEWEYGDVCNGEYGKVFIIYDNDAVVTCKKKELTSWSFAEVDPETIGMYTGFQDSNGLRIYDGDILQLTGQHEEIDNSIQRYIEVHKIVWLNGCFYAHNNNNGCPCLEILSQVIHGLRKCETYEIVGRMHNVGIIKS